MGSVWAHTGAIGCIGLSKPTNGFYLPVAPALVVICVGVISDGLFTDGKSTTNQGWTLWLCWLVVHRETHVVVPMGAHCYLYRRLIDFHFK